jgi:hypothetical protein
MPVSMVGAGLSPQLSIKISGTTKITTINTAILRLLAEIQLTALSIVRS